MGDLKKEFFNILLEEGDHKGAIKAFNEVTRLYKVDNLNPHTLPTEYLNEYVSFIGPSYIGLALAFAMTNDWDTAKDRLAVAKTLEILYGASSPEIFLQKFGYDNMIKIIKKIESHTYSWDK